MGSRAAYVALALVLISVAELRGAGAQGKPSAQKSGSGKQATPAVDVRTIHDKLKTNDAARMLEALAAAQSAGVAAAGAAPAIEEVLKRGASEAVMKAAIGALSAIGAVSSSAVLRPYVRHRNQELRRAAVKALASTKGGEAIHAFKEGLRSFDAMVRGYSASGLGNAGSTEALPDLFTALEHNVTEAAGAIGQLCPPEECERFAARFLGKVGFDVMTTGFDAILFRTNALPEDTRIKIVVRVRELGTPEAAKYLSDVQGRLPEAGSLKVKQAIDNALASMPGARGGK
jgi:HEAT repeat protein